MIAIMCDALELGRFERDVNNILRLKLHDGVNKSWLPYIFEIGLNDDMDKIIKIWKKDRVFPRNRVDARKMLKSMGLKHYNLDKIAYITRCSLIIDPYWIVYEETDRYYVNSIRGQLGVSRYPYNSLGIVNEEDYIWRK